MCGSRVNLESSFTTCFGDVRFLRCSIAEIQSFGKSWYPKIKLLRFNGSELWYQKQSIFTSCRSSKHLLLALTAIEMNDQYRTIIAILG